MKTGKLCRIIGVFSVLLVVAPLFAEAQTLPEVTLTFDQNGLTGILVDQTNVLSTNNLSVTAVRLADDWLNPYEEENPYLGDTRTKWNGSTSVLSTTFDQNLQKLTRTYAWGKVHLTYGAVGNRLDLTIEIENTSSYDVIRRVVFDALRLALPDNMVVTLPTAAATHRTCNIGEPLVRVGTYDGGRIAFASPQSNAPVVLALPKRSTGVFGLNVDVGHDGMPASERYDEVWQFREVDVMQSDVIEVSVYFGPETMDPHDLAIDVINNYPQDVPMLLNWPDRRPIAAVWMATWGSTQGANNPRNWQGLNLTHHIDTPEGRQQFRTWLINRANTIVNVAKATGTQGVIIWDISGSEFQSHQYYGDPRLLPHLAPEMHENVDDFFEILTDAGLEVGVCIRPTLIQPRDAQGQNMATWDGFVTIATRSVALYTAEQTPPHCVEAERTCPGARINVRIDYAKNRWGAKVYYVDTPHLWRPRTQGFQDWGWSSRMMGAHYFRDILNDHPDVLMIPEHGYFETLAYTSMYAQPNYSYPTRDRARKMYPEAFSSVYIANITGTVQQQYEYYSNVVSKGDTLMVHGWWTGGGNSEARTVYELATLYAPIRVRIDSNNDITVNGVAIGENELENWIATLTSGRSFAERRTLLRYDASLSYGEVNAYLNTIKAGGGIAAWATSTDFATSDFKFVVADQTTGSEKFTSDTTVDVVVMPQLGSVQGTTLYAITETSDVPTTWSATEPTDFTFTTPSEDGAVTLWGWAKDSLDDDNMVSAPASIVYIYTSWIGDPTIGNVTWVGGGSTPNWGNAGNWDVDMYPANPTNATITFNEQGAGVDGVLAPIEQDKNGVWSVGHWRLYSIAYADAYEQILDLNGNTLKVNSSVAIASYPWSGNGTVKDWSNFTLKNGTLQVGSPGSPIHMTIGRSVQQTTKATLKVEPGTTLDANLNLLNIGGTPITGWDRPRKHVGILDLRGATVANLVMNQLHLGTNDDRYYALTDYSAIFLDGDTDIDAIVVKQTARIGYSWEGHARGRIGNPSDANFKLPAGVSFVFGNFDAQGQPVSRANVYVGVLNNHRSVSTSHFGIGYIAASSGGTIKAYLDELIVGESDRTGAQGTLDLAAMDSCEMDIVTLQMGALAQERTDANRIGLLTLPPGTVTVQNVNLGRPAGGTIDIVLNGTQFEVTDSLVVREIATIEIDISGFSGGLIMPSSLQPTITGNVVLNFLSDRDQQQGGIYYGLKWEGNKVSELQALITSGNLTIHDNTTSGVSIFQSGGYTYIGQQ